MKPKDWNRLSEDDKMKIGRELLGSMRGSYLISQALHYGIKAMRDQTYPEESNAQDMEILRETVFPLFLPIPERGE